MKIRAYIKFCLLHDVIAILMVSALLLVTVTLADHGIFESSKLADSSEHTVE